MQKLGSMRSNNPYNPFLGIATAVTRQARWYQGRLHPEEALSRQQALRFYTLNNARILFLEGRPIVSKLNQINIGSEVPAQHQNDWTAEDGAIKNYNEGIRLALELGDNGSRELMDSILKDEEEHIDWIEAQLDEIKQMGVQNYLVEQID